MRVVSLLMIGVVVVRCSYSNGKKLPFKEFENSELKYDILII